MSKWFFAIDKGGTFTDIIGIDPHNKIHTNKILSQSPAYTDSVVEGIRQVLGLKNNERIPSEKIERIRIGTTIATNALLERKGATTALLITSGFKDLLEIGNQARPSLFDLSIVKPEQLYASVIEVDERLDSNGEVVVGLDRVKLQNDLKKFKTQIEIDGGINFENAKMAKAAGVDILVSGTTIFKENEGNLKKNIQLLRTG